MGMIHSTYTIFRNLCLTLLIYTPILAEQIPSTCNWILILITERLTTYNTRFWEILSMLKVSKTKKYINVQAVTRISNTVHSWLIDLRNKPYGNDSRFTLPVIGTEKTPAFLRQGLPYLSSSCFHHLRFRCFFCRRHNAQRMNQGRSTLTFTHVLRCWRGSGLTSATSVAVCSPSEVHIPTPKNKFKCTYFKREFICYNYTLQRQHKSHVHETIWNTNI